MHEGEVSAALGIAGVPSVSESTMIARDCALAAFEEARIHVQHLSAFQSVAVIEHAKAYGVEVTCEATPHHLTLTDEEVRSLDSRFKMNPPLRTEADRQALIEGDAHRDDRLHRHRPRAAHPEREGGAVRAGGDGGDRARDRVLGRSTPSSSLPGAARAGDGGRAPRRRAPSRSASSTPRIAPGAEANLDPVRPRRRVGGRGRGLGEPLGELLLRRSQAARRGC